MARRVQRAGTDTRSVDGGVPRDSESWPSRTRQSWLRPGRLAASRSRSSGPSRIGPG